MGVLQLTLRVRPPSTSRLVPVMNDAGAEQRKTAAAAISSGEPRRPGTVSRASAWASSRVPSPITRSVAIRPGWRKFRVTPSAA